MRRGRFSIPAVMALAAVTLIPAPTPAGAAPYGPFTLTDVSQTASWSGQLEASPPVLPEACVPDVCDIVEVNVQLPEGVWAQPGGMLVATQTPGDHPSRSDDIDIFGLYVYGPDGREVARATSIWSTGDHAAWVENPVNGVYKIVIAPFLFDDPPAYYDGLVSFDRGITVKREELKNGMPYTQKFVAFGLASPPSPAVELLPDLVPAAPGNFHIETGVCLNASACDPTPAHQPSCYPQETTGESSHTVPPTPGPLRCLRFDQGESNVGSGPLEMRIYPGQGTDIYQRVYRSDGSLSPRPPVGGAVFHPTHAHWHYTGGGRWWDIKMYNRLPNGEPDLEQGPVSTFADKGICPLDIVSARFGQHGNGPQGYGNEDLHTCFTPRDQDPNDPDFPNEPYIKAGISVGWSDFYPWTVLDMYLDITNVPDGKYVIVTKQDPDGRLFEESTANNTAMACVEFSGITARACPPEPDLSLAKAGPSGRVPTGRNMTYTLTVANNGPDDASEVTVIDQLPPSVSFVSAAPSRGSCGESAGTVTCALGSMANGAIATVDIVVRPNTAGTITNTASVSGIEVDPNQTNNTDSVDTSVCRITSRRSSIPCG